MVASMMKQLIIYLINNKIRGHHILEDGSGLIDAHGEDVNIIDLPDIKLLSERFKALKPV